MLEIRNLNFSYNKNKVIKDFSLFVEEGSFTTLLGPSGCGKTTLLKLISGFLEPDSGEIFINSKNICGIPPEKRKVGMVFQDYALFPHLTVEKNIGYGLNLISRQKGASKQEYKKENYALVYQIARILGIANLLERFPHELSGGQQQRVALARALVLKPGVLLMDEPLSSLDAKLRSQVREELKEIQQKFKITTIYVTHDQEEALFLSDKIAVINHGQLLQVGNPAEIYFSPKDAFTASFIGTANFLSFKDEKNNSEKTCVIRPSWAEVLPVSDFSDKVLASNSSFLLKSEESLKSLYGTVVSSSFFGSFIRYKINLFPIDAIFFADVPSTSSLNFSRGDKVQILIRKNYWL